MDIITYACSVHISPFCQFGKKILLRLSEHGDVSSKRKQ